MTRLVAYVFVVAALVSTLGALGSAALAHPGHSPSTTPASNLNPAPPGERSPLVAVAAGAAVVIAGGAGIFIYRVIRKGF